MEPENEGLEDDFLFQIGDLQVPAVHFPGCIGSDIQILLRFDQMSDLS